MARKASGGKMRNIKFRVWNNNEDVFHCLQFTDTGIKTENDPLTRGCVVYQQYTGLKDKNGKDIYEGDIVLASCANCEIKGEVYYQSPCFVILENEREYNLYNYDSIEVIGNIFERDNVCPKCNMLMRTDIWRQRRGDTGQVRYTCTDCGHTEVNK